MIISDKTNKEKIDFEKLLNNSISALEHAANYLLQPYPKKIIETQNFASLPIPPSTVLFHLECFFASS
ncbi:hypothetical protein TI03_03730 [Achromatium sp. WMS1]|nr:hypothetical protein TI03_03730 [Achromatium sp. WMS1]